MKLCDWLFVSEIQGTSTTTTTTATYHGRLVQGENTTTTMTTNTTTTKGEKSHLGDFFNVLIKREGKTEHNTKIIGC